MADLVTLFLYPQQVSDFEHEMVSMADLVTLFLCPQPVSDFQHEMGVNSLDQRVKEGTHQDSGYFSDSSQVKKQGKPLLEVLEDSGLFGKALSLG